jgi:hypothetical protein
MKITSTIAALLLLLQTTQAPTPAQRIDQIQALLEELRAAIGSPTPAPGGVTVTDAAGLVAALRNGGAITVAPGSYAGNFTISKPTTIAGAGATLVAADPFTPTLKVAANDVVVKGLAVQLGNPDRDAIVVGTLEATSADAQPHRVRFEDVKVLPSAKGGGHRGFALHGSEITLQRVSVLGFYEKGRDSQAVWICNGPGPYAVLDSVLEASGENLLVGGATPGIVGMNPADITIRGNTLRKPDAFRTLGTVKNSFELKIGIRVVFEGNTIDGNWIDGQGGSPIVISVRGQGDCPWCTIDAVTIRGNTVRRALDGFAVNVLGRDDSGPSGQLRTLTIDHNLFAESPNGIQVINGVADALVVTNNTLPRISSRFLQFEGSNPAKVITPITWSRNVHRTGDYGIMGDGSTGPGLASLTSYARIVEFAGNVIEMSDQRTIPLPPNPGQVLKAGALAALLDPATFKLLAGGAGY